MNQFFQIPRVRNYWGWNAPLVFQGLSDLADVDDCYRLSIYSSPPVDSQVIPAGGYAQGQISLRPGSFVYRVTANVTPGPFQITDLNVNHTWFDSPISISPGYLLAPYPVVAPGLFRIEQWNNQATSERGGVIFLVAEVK